MSVLLFFIILLALVLVHELGHFIVAKRSGIRVDEFGVGFPPKLFGVRKGETLYSVNALPFGGFVKIFGETPDQEALYGPDSARSFVRKPKLVQAAVLVAGVAMNVFFAWILYSGAFLIGMPTAVDPAHREGVSDARVLVTRVVPSSPAERAGMQPGDNVQFLAVGGIEIAVTEPRDIADFIALHGGEEVTVAFLRDGVVHRVNITPTANVEGIDRLAIGIATELIGTQKLSLLGALGAGAVFTADSTWAILKGVGGLIAGALTFSADLSQITGPVGIVSLVGDASSLGFVYLLTFTAFISINLAIINLLPFPALDGGRLLFVAIEALKGSPIRPRVANVANSVGFAVLILLMLLVTYRDIVRLVG